jgi:CheY-like chemotaxis protein
MGCALGKSAWEAAMRKEEVLVIDDNQMTRDTIMLLLEDQGFSVQGCANGKSAIDLSKRKNFAIYLIDYRMPGMKGDAVAAMIRKLSPEAYIIGFSLESKEQAFLEAGANKFIIKDHFDKKLIPLIKKEFCEHPLERIVI